MSVFFRAKSLALNAISIFSSLVLLLILLTMMINESYAAETQGANNAQVSKGVMSISPIITETIELTGFDASTDDEFGVRNGRGEQYIGNRCA